MPLPRWRDLPVTHEPFLPPLRPRPDGGQAILTAAQARLTGDVTNLATPAEVCRNGTDPESFTLALRVVVFELAHRHAMPDASVPFALLHTVPGAERTIALIRRCCAGRGKPWWMSNRDWYATVSDLVTHLFAAGCESVDLAAVVGACRIHLHTLAETGQESPVHA